MLKAADMLENLDRLAEFRLWASTLGDVGRLLRRPLRILALTQHIADFDKRIIYTFLGHDPVRC